MGMRQPGQRKMTRRNLRIDFSGIRAVSVPSTLCDQKCARAVAGDGANRRRAASTSGLPVILAVLVLPVLALAFALLAFVLALAFDLLVTVGVTSPVTATDTLGAPIVDHSPHAIIGSPGTLSTFPVPVDADLGGVGCATASPAWRTTAISATTWTTRAAGATA